jgi:uncharacterized protein (TIGR03086 family)
MDSFLALDAARFEFDRRLGTVNDAQWATPTPCEGWTVRDLVTHVISGNNMTVRILGGGTKEEALAILAGGSDSRAESDPYAAFVASADEQAKAFREPGALDRTVHHPVMDMSGAQQLVFRTGDLLLHAWDLAKAIGGDEQIDDALVRHVWDEFEPMAPFIGEIGLFGTGPSDTVAEDAPFQQRLLDLSGRRP